MPEKASPISAAAVAVVIVIVIVIIVAVAVAVALVRRGRRRKDGYLVYPYIDLDEPGERGSYYALSEC